MPKLMLLELDHKEAQKKEIKGYLNARLGLEAPFPECVLIDILLSQS